MSARRTLASRSARPSKRSLIRRWFIEFVKPADEEEKIRYAKSEDPDDNRQIVVQFLARSMESVERARGRAQVCHAIVGALGLAFATAVISGQFNNSGAFVAIAAIASLIVWVFAIGFYLSAVAGAEVPGIVEEAASGTADNDAMTHMDANEAYDAVMDQVQADRNDTLWRLRRANRTAVTFTLFATLTAIFSFLVSPTIERVKVEVTFTTTGQTHIRTACNLKSGPVIVEIASRAIEGEYIDLYKVDGCGDNIVLTIPRRWIDLIVSRSGADD